jgi:hypothetical protein
LKSFADLKAQFKNESRRALEELEAERLKFKKSQRTALLVSLAIIGVGVILSLLAQNPLPLILAVIIAIIVYFVIVGNKKKTIIGLWKNLIIQKLVRSLGEDFTYHASDRIKEHEYKESKIFLTGVDRYHGEDLIEGTIDKTEIKFSELKTEYKTTSTNSKGHRTTHWHTIFNGIFMITEFNKEFNVNMVVLPDVAQNMFGVFGQTLQSMNSSRDSLVKLEDPNFEKSFVVYADDQLEARYILTPSFMERILELESSLPGKLYLSFINSRLFVAFTTNKNYFEPNFAISFTDITEIKNHYDHLLGIVQIIEDLDLNTRIWTKE